MRTATTQSNKIVLNDVKDSKALLEPSYRKKTSIHLANPTTLDR